jgi:hypothetical protein
LQHPAASSAQHVRECPKLFLGGAEGGDIGAVARSVEHGAEGPDPDCSCPDRLIQQCPHRRAVFGGRGVAPHPALAHHEHPQRGMRDQGRHIDVVSPPFQPGEILSTVRIVCRYLIKSQS